jgi:hypothetical protein
VYYPIRNNLHNRNLSILLKPDPLEIRIAPKRQPKAFLDDKALRPEKDEERLSLMIHYIISCTSALGRVES